MPNAAPLPPRILLSSPHMGGAERRYVEQAFDSNYIAPLGPMVDAFEKHFADYTGIPHCVALNSGTAAIHLALRGVGVGAGDRVYASTLTFIGGVAPIKYQHALPVFVDADPTTWNMDPALVAEALARDAARNMLPKAVLATDLYGQSVDIDALRAVCDPHGVPLIVDAAESVGASYGDRHTGVGAKAACFSFNGNKIITTSGGGMLASEDRALIEEARFLSQQARDPAPHYQHTTFGYNYRMSNMVAAIGLGQMEVLDERVAQRRQIFAWYQQHLAGVAGIRFMPEAPYGGGNRWLSVITLDAASFGEDPTSLRLRLEAANIESRPMWKPMHLQPVFEGVERIGGAVSEALFRDGLCLPSGTQMSEADVIRVAECIRAR